MMVMWHHFDNERETQLICSESLRWDLYRSRSGSDKVGTLIRFQQQSKCWEMTTEMLWISKCARLLSVGWNSECMRVTYDYRCVLPWDLGLTRLHRPHYYCKPHVTRKYANSMKICSVYVLSRLYLNQRKNYTIALKMSARELKEQLRLSTDQWP